MVSRQSRKVKEYMVSTVQVLLVGEGVHGVQVIKEGEGEHGVHCPGTLSRWRSTWYSGTQGR